MTSEATDGFVRHLRLAVASLDVPARSDGELLGDFIERRDSEAFERLVRRHGPMVLGVCLRILAHRQDAEDAFRASTRNAA